MTFIVGMNCTDGIVLCTDSLEEDGVTKKTVNKIRQMGTAEWGVAIAGAGPALLIDKFCDEVHLTLPRVRFDWKIIEGTIEKALGKFHKKYVKHSEDWFEVIVGVYSGLGMERRIYKGSGIVLTRVTDAAHTGRGNELWRLIEDTLYTRRNCVADNARLAIFATRLACKYVSGVAEPIQVISHTFGDRFFRGYSMEEIAQIEAEFSHDSFLASIRKYWRLHNPPTRTQQLDKFQAIRTPGDELILLDGVKVEELSTIVGRKRATKTFRRNLDKLLKFASEDQKRIIRSVTVVPPSSDGSAHT